MGVSEIICEGVYETDEPAFDQRGRELLLDLLPPLLLPLPADGEEEEEEDEL
jgi:hypothetical protein